MKLCKDCKYFAGTKAPVECTHNKNTIPDYVNGAHRALYCSAQSVRLGFDMCGPEGKWFEPKANGEVV